jgi:hypothetical protein
MFSLLYGRGHYDTSYSAETPDQNTGEEEEDETSDSRLLMQM